MSRSVREFGPEPTEEFVDFLEGFDDVPGGYDPRRIPESYCDGLIEVRADLWVFDTRLDKRPDFAKHHAIGQTAGSGDIEHWTHARYSFRVNRDRRGPCGHHIRSVNDLMFVDIPQSVENPEPCSTGSLNVPSLVWLRFLDDRESVAGDPIEWAFPSLGVPVFDALEPLEFSDVDRETVVSSRSLSVSEDELPYEMVERTASRSNGIAQHQSPALRDRFLLMEVEYMALFDRIVLTRESLPRIVLKEPVSLFTQRFQVAICPVQLSPWPDDGTPHGTTTYAATEDGAE